jgi:hypothetical protein
VLEIRPDVILAEHGGPYMFDTEDYRRRVKWGEAAGKACDALSISGDHLRDWSPLLLSVEPTAVTVRPGEAKTITLRVTAGRDPMHIFAVCGGAEDITGGFASEYNLRAGQTMGETFVVEVSAGVKAGRYIVSLWAAPWGERFAQQRSNEQLTDSYLVVDVPPK